MRIIQSQIQSSAKHALDSQEARREEESRREIQIRRDTSETPSSGRQAPGLIVDRVQLSHTGSRRAVSEYRAALQSRSKVTTDQGDKAVFRADTLVEKLLGSATGQHVALRQLSSGEIPLEAVTLEDGDRIDQVRENPARSSLSRISEIAMKKAHVQFEAETLAYQTRGTVVTEDGRTIEFDLALDMDRTMLTQEEEQTLISSWKEKIALVDPLMIQLDGGIPTLSQARFEFDLNSDGNKENLNLPAAGTGFLAFDRNGDGVINNGSELFGPGTGNGFEELAALDEDGNRWIDENDAAFEQLSVWVRDESGEDRLISLKEAGVGAVSLDYTATTFSHTDENNELSGQVRGSAAFLFETGKAGLVQQGDLAVKEPEVQPENGVDLAMAQDPVKMAVEAFQKAAGEREEILDRLKARVMSLREELQAVLKERYGLSNSSKDSPISRYDHYKMTSPNLFAQNPWAPGMA